MLYLFSGPDNSSDSGRFNVLIEAYNEWFATEKLAKHFKDRGRPLDIKPIKYIL